MADDMRLKVAAQSLVRRARAGDQNAIATIIMVRKARKRSPRAAMAFDILRVYINDHPSIIDTEGFDIGSENVSATKTLVKCAESENVDKYSNCMINTLVKMSKSVEASLEAASLISSGKDIDDRILATIASRLPGEVTFAENGKVIIGGVEAAEKAGRKPTANFSVKWADGKVKVKPISEKSFTRGYIVTEKGKPRAVPSHDIFTAAFNSAVYSDKVVGWSAGMSGRAREILQLGYTLGLAKRIQDITRYNAKISTLSEMVAWELGE